MHVNLIRSPPIFHRHTPMNQKLKFVEQMLLRIAVLVVTKSGLMVCLHTKQLSLPQRATACCNTLNTTNSTEKNINGKQRFETYCKCFLMQS